MRKQKVVKINIKKLEEDVNNNPDAYKYNRANCLEVSQVAVYLGLRRLGVTYKKVGESKKADKEERSMFSKNRTIQIEGNGSSLCRWTRLCTRHKKDMRLF